MPHGFVDSVSDCCYLTLVSPSASSKEGSSPLAVSCDVYTVTKEWTAATATELNLTALYGTDISTAPQSAADSDGSSSGKGSDDALSGSLSDRKTLLRSAYSVQMHALSPKDILRHAVLFKSLCADYRSYVIEQQEYSIKHCGIDVSNVNQVFAFLQKELTASGFDQ